MSLPRSEFTFSGVRAAYRRTRLRLEDDEKSCATSSWPAYVCKCSEELLHLFPLYDFQQQRDFLSSRPDHLCLIVLVLFHCCGKVALGVFRRISNVFDQVMVRFRSLVAPGRRLLMSLDLPNVSAPQATIDDLKLHFFEIDPSAQQSYQRESGS